MKQHDADDHEHSKQQPVQIRIGIDLGTTYSCTAHIGSDALPHVIPSASGNATMPSVLCFDGRIAIVGERARQSCLGRPGHLFEFVKRDTGRPSRTGSASDPEPAPYRVAGVDWGVVGMQAILLRKLKLNAIQGLKQSGALDDAADEANTDVQAVITVPAYFGDVERRQTREAALCAGLNAIGIINEPTAAALAYGATGRRGRRLVVFDFGGGTFDVSIVELHGDGSAKVIAKDGNHTLGGKDVDDIIIEHLKDRFFQQNGLLVDEAGEGVLRREAPAIKHRLTDEESIEVALNTEVGLAGSVNAILSRTPPVSHNPYDVSDAFYLEERATNLFSKIRALSESALRQSKIPVGLLDTRPMEWNDLDEVVLVGGSCRLPIVHRLVEDMTGLRPVPHPPGFDYDTAVAIGAALYAERPDTVTDVAARGVGIKTKRRVGERTRSVVRVLIANNTPLPARVVYPIKAEQNARLEIYQGDTDEVHSSNLRGFIDLANPAGAVTIELQLDRDGELTAKAILGEPGGELSVKTLTIANVLFEMELVDLKARVMTVRFED